jgi:hypothetical protein
MRYINPVYIILSFFLLNTTVSSQQFNIRNNSYFLPRELTPGKFTHLMGLAALKMPEDIIEDETFLRTPIFYYKVRMGLPQNLNLLASFESNIITLHFETGIGWNLILNNFSTSTELKASYWTGRLKQFGFDSGMSGFEVIPGLSAGYSFTKFSITLKTELLYIISNVLKTGDIVVSRDPRKLNGYSAGLFVEQPLWNNNVVVIGFKSIMIELYYPIWVAFSTFKRRFHVTEASVGLVL